MDANGSSNGRVTYAEVRRVAGWLSIFTARDLANALHVNLEVGNRFVLALTWQGIAVDTGDELAGPAGDPETIYEMVPLPDGYLCPRNKRTPPEIVAVIQMYGGIELISPRGKPVRIRTERRMRQAMSTPGSRQKHVNREREFQRQKQAREEAARTEERKRKAAAGGKKYVPLAEAADDDD